MEARISSSLGLPSPNPNPHRHPTDFPSILNHFAATATNPPFASTTATATATYPTEPAPKPQTLLKNLTVVERALIGAAGGGIAGAFTYVCLHPLDTIKTKMQTKGASQIYKNALDAVVKTFQQNGILGFYSGVSAVIVGSTASSAVYFGTCEQILKEEGWVGLTRGMGPRVLHSACFSALGYFAFETARLTILQQYLRQKELSEVPASPS
ncbi:hypothetical protein Ahy_A05g021873 isoform A [Arachis hypogaea]|uniref:Uncharacterized protein n=1 Tax=Arachis hypogaea TaxID=3818 RepID=A0A445CYR6_ARAHY|nr:hypothetical protein Ahy_A05g021873 isoform A [Arachis hypogaea]